MLGRQHLMLSVATASVLLAPHLRIADQFVIVMFFGVAIGSLIPDVDAPDAAIFHEDIRGLNGDTGEIVNNFVGPLLPVFGYTTKYLIYKPAVIIYDSLIFDDYSFQEKHRFFSHSVLGVLTMTAITGIYMVPVLILIELFAPLYLLAFLSAYAFGCFLHMLEDSCTKTGIAWNSPFSNTKLKGEISTGKDIKKPRYFLTYLGGLAAVSFFLGTSNQYSLSFIEVTAFSILSLVLSWLVFVKLISRAKIEH